MKTGAAVCRYTRSPTPVRFVLRLFVSRRRIRLPAAITYSGGDAASAEDTASGDETTPARLEKSCRGFVTGRGPGAKVVPEPRSRTSSGGRTGWGETEVIAACVGR